MFEAELLDHAVEEILDLAPDLVVVAGDLTSEGYAPSSVRRSGTSIGSRDSR